MWPIRETRKYGETHRRLKQAVENINKAIVKSQKEGTRFDLGETIRAQNALNGEGGLSVRKIRKYLDKSVGFSGAMKCRNTSRKLVDPCGTAGRLGGLKSKSKSDRSDRPVNDSNDLADLLARAEQAKRASWDEMLCILANEIYGLRLRDKVKYDTTSLVDIRHELISECSRRVQRYDSNLGLADFRAYAFDQRQKRLREIGDGKVDAIVDTFLKRTIVDSEMVTQLVSCIQKVNTPAGHEFMKAIAQHFRRKNTHQEPFLPLWQDVVAVELVPGRCEYLSVPIAALNSYCQFLHDNKRGRELLEILHLIGNT